MPTGSYNQAISIATALVSNIIAILLAKGAISISDANQLSASAATIGAVLIFLVVNGALIIGNQWHRLRYGPVPALATVQSGTPSVQLASFAGAPSPSYGVPSTGSPQTVDTGDVPTEVV